MVDAEEQARALVDTWLLWLRALATEAPPTLRIDLLLSRAGPGRAELHTLELSHNRLQALATPTPYLTLTGCRRCGQPYP